MVKRILIFVLTFAAALGGATGLVVMRAKPAAPAAPPADSAKAPTARDSSAAPDSAHTAVAAALAKDSEPIVRAAAMPPRDSVRSPATPIAPADTAATDRAPAPSTPSVPAVARATQAAPVTTILAGGRLSKIFGAMAPRDAAKVLEQMDDADIKEILGRLNDKKAAEILALLPAARAALISKAALAVPGPGK